MRGHQKLIELRQSGMRPAVVFVNDYPTNPAYLDGTTVDISGDDLTGIDLRFLMGLTVSTGSQTEVRAREILEACKRAGAALVASCHIPKARAEKKPTDYLEIWSAQNEHAA